jgi:hypothetical protein
MLFEVYVFGSRDEVEGARHETPHDSRIWLAAASGFVWTNEL